MRFALTEDQILLRDAVAAVLTGECTPDTVRAAWDAPDGRGGLWPQLAENGVLGILAPESVGGLEMTEIEMVLALEEAGFAAVPEPLLETLAIAVPALTGAAATAETRAIASALVSGQAAATSSLSPAPYAPYASSCDWVIVERAGDLFAVPAALATLTPHVSVDRTRQLSEVGFEPSEALALGSAVDARHRGTLGAAAMLVGLSRRMLDMAVEYAGMRTQFGRPIGAFQAVQHRCADALMRIEFARPLVYQAAWSMANDAPDAGVHVSMAKAYASEAALNAAKASLQVHGAIGYSTEYDLHLYMKRAWALAANYGTAREHRRILADHLLGAPAAG